MVGTTKKCAWVWPMNNIALKPASIFPDDDETVLVRTKILINLEINPKWFQKVTTDYNFLLTD